MLGLGLSITKGSPSGLESAAFFSGLLDDYSGATAAYSLRKLTNDHTGSAIRVRRASDHEEQDIGFVNNELDTATLTTFCSGTNGFVATWFDQAGSNDATQTAPGNQPKIYDSVTGVLEENGKPCCLFGSNINVMLETSAISHTDGAVSIFTVVNKSGNTYSQVFVVDCADNAIFGSSHGYRLDTFGDRYRFGTNQNVTSGSTFTPPTGQKLFTGIANSSGRTIYLNGASDATTSGDQTTTYSSTEEIVLGNRNVGGAGSFDGKVQEIVIYESDQDSNRTGIETNINDFYSIYP